MKAAVDIEAPRARQLAALPWRIAKDGSLQVLLITSRTNKKWMLPKGWPMSGKTDAQAATQEAQEEAGVLGVAREAPVGSFAYIMLFGDGSTKPSQAVVFSLRVTKEQRKWREKGERTRKWFSAEDAAKAAYEPDLARLLSHVAGGRIVL